MTQEATDGELEPATRRNLPFFGSVIQSIRRKGSMRSLAVNNVQVPPHAVDYWVLIGIISAQLGYSHANSALVYLILVLIVSPLHYTICSLSCSCPLCNGVLGPFPHCAT